MNPILRVLDTLYPPLCLLCGEECGSGKELCSLCDEALIHSAKTRFVQSSFNAIDQQLSLFPYDEQSSLLIHNLKYHNRTRPVEELVATIATQLPLSTYDAIVPVPLHWLRLLRRGYNQSARIARSLSTEKQSNLLIRKRYTTTQTKRAKEARAKAMSGVFAAREELTNKRILLVDDVVTTGSTASNCATILKRAGAQTVDLFTIAAT